MALRNLFKFNHNGVKYSNKEPKDVDGIKAGIIDPQIKENEGGAPQYITPFSVAQLKKLNMLSDV